MIHRTSDVTALRSSTVPAAWVVVLVCGRLRLHGCETPTQAACQHRSVVWSMLCSGPPPYVCIEKRAALLCVEHTTASAHAVVPTGGPASHSPPRWAALAASGCMPTGDDIMNILTRILEPHAHCQLERSHVGGIAAALEDPPLAGPCAACASTAGAQVAAGCFTAIPAGLRRWRRKQK